MGECEAHGGIRMAASFWNALDGLVAGARCVIDRPAGSRHPRFPDMIYPVAYGSLEGTASMDGGGIDVWRGTRPQPVLDALICTVDVLKKDSEIKLLLGCTPREKAVIYDFCNASPCMKGVLVERGDG